MTTTSSRAHVEYDPIIDGIRLVLLRHGTPETGYRQIVQWPTLTVDTIDPAGENVRREQDADWLRLPEADARALYEALGEHFGHAGHDVRALRRDYDAERSRVDRLLGHLIRSGT